MSKPGPLPWWLKRERDKWLLLSPTLMAKHRHISLALAEKVKREMTRNPDWNGYTPADCAEAERGEKLSTEADSDALDAALNRAYGKRDAEQRRN